MSEHDAETLRDSIRALVATIPHETGEYGGYSEGHDITDRIFVNVYVQHAGTPHIMQASSDPQDDELSLTELLDEVVEWIAAHRKEDAA